MLLNKNLLDYFFIPFLQTECFRVTATFQKCCHCGEKLLLSSPLKSNKTGNKPSVTFIQQHNTNTQTYGKYSRNKTQSQHKGCRQLSSAKSKKQLVSFIFLNHVKALFILVNSLETDNKQFRFASKS